MGGEKYSPDENLSEEIMEIRLPIFLVYKLVAILSIFFYIQYAFLFIFSCKSVVLFLFQVYWVDVLVLFGFFIFLRLIGYFVLKFKIHMDR